MTRYLVTGAAGFVGTYLRRALHERHDERDIISLAASGEASDTVVVADLCDRHAIHDAVERIRPDVIVHLAAQASVARTINDLGATFATNLGGSLNLALAAARHTPKCTLLFASTSEVYGASFLNGPVAETSVPLPLNTYARSKLLAEATFAAVLPETARLIVARPFNHTGPGQSVDFVLPSFAAQIARIEASRQTHLQVGNLDVRRDFLDVRDVVNAYLALIEAAFSLPHRLTCNIASGTSHLLRSHVQAMCDMSSGKVEVVVDPNRLRSADVPVACGNSALLKSLTGWVPQHPLDQTIQALLDHARAVETVA